MDDVQWVQLQIERYVTQIRLAEELLFDVDVRVGRDFIQQQLLVQFRTKLLTDQLPPERLSQRTHVPYEVPASTWQMLKAAHGRRWYARWLVSRRPVRYGLDPNGRGTDAVCEFDLRRFRAYPQARVPVPAQPFGCVVYGHVIDSPQWTVDVAGDAK